MSEHRAFGVGCFHFGYRKTPPFELSTKQYIEEIRTTLSALPSVSQIEITYDQAFAETARVEEEPPILSDGEFFPNVMFLEIKFTVFIPKRVQEELFPNESGAMRAATEKFSVSIRYGFHGPVTYIECIDAEENCSPSDAVRLMREYLERELSKLSTSVRFEFLGPSPFHANFYVRPATGDVPDIVMEEIKQRGYNDFVFRCSMGADLDEVLDFLYYELSHELDLFYEIQRRSVRLMNQGEGVVDTWLQLQLSVSDNHNFFNIPTRFRIHQSAQKLISDSYALQAQVAVDQKETEHNIASVYDMGTDTYLESFIRSRLERLPSYPVESILRWAEHISNSSFKQAEIAAIILAAIGGGIVGSFVTAAMSAAGG